MSRIFLIRHAPTHTQRLIGWTDEPADLSDSIVLDKLRNSLPIDALVVSSDLIRCIDTANAILGERKQLPHESGLRELNFGDWENKTFAEIKKKDAVLSRKYWSNPGNISPPNGESWNETAVRVTKTIDSLMEANPDKDLIIVVHFGVILTQLQRVINMATRSALAFKIENLSVTTLERIDSRWRILGVNQNVLMNYF